MIEQLKITGVPKLKNLLKTSKIFKYSRIPKMYKFTQNCEQI